MKTIELTDLDRRIWEEELDEFVPKRVFDVHTHAYRWAFNTDPQKDMGAAYSFIGRDFPEADWAALELCDRLLMPGREVHRLAFPFPFSPGCDFPASNEFVIRQTQQDAASAALMLVHPSMSADFLDAEAERCGFLGFKPYRTYSTTGDASQCRITDFLPTHQIEVAHRRGLIIMLHLSKRNALADPQNLDDLALLTDQYPDAKWILAHCARSYSSWAIEKAAGRLRALRNVWYDTSSVCETDAFDALYSAAGIERVMYGSDDIPIGVTRGKYITFGFAWTFLSEHNHSLSLAHADSRMTFTRYEQLRAMSRAARRAGLAQQQIEMMFYGTAAALIKSARHGVSRKLSTL
ncbi:MAG TPA: amidohydrolase family protein [Candidatus Saccharimonadales bacterium]|nr:amidohydrolase family protein [Candidatus Saccharimonadales bacterium]